MCDNALDVDDFYKGYVIEITKGKGKENNRQMRIIKSYDGKSKIATIDLIWNILPDSNSEFVIHRNSGSIQEATQFIPLKI